MGDPYASITRPIALAPRVLDLLSSLGLFDLSRLRYAASYLAKGTDGVAWPFPSRAAGPNRAMVSARQIMSLILALCAAHRTTGMAGTYERIVRVVSVDSEYPDRRVVDVFARVLVESLDDGNEYQTLLSELVEENFALKVNQSGDEVDMCRFDPERGVGEIDTEFRSRDAAPVLPAAIRYTRILPLSALLRVSDGLRDQHAGRAVLREAA